MGAKGKKILLWVIIIFIIVGIYKSPEQWGANVNNGIDAIETGAERGGTFLNTVFDGQ